MTNDKDKEIEILIRARYPIIYAVTWEEKRVEDALSAIARSRNKGIYVWTITDGLVNPQIQGRFPENLKNPVEILEYVRKSKESALFIIKDFHHYMDDPVILRKLKDTAQAIKKSHNTLIILGSELKIPQELEKDITVVDYPLPDYSEIKNLLQCLIQQVSRNPRVKVEVTPEIEEKLVKAAMGLTLKEAENVFARAVVMNNHLGEEDINVILLEKEQIIRKSETLEYYHAEEKFGHVGGLDILKKWLVKRGSAFTEKARDYGLPQPKGILLLGVQGCGKSLCAKVVSSLWNLPLLRLDMGSIFGGIIGSSEGNIRKAIKTAESLSPCVLWIDEIEKGLSGTSSSGASDGGTTARVFGSILSWMQEKTCPVFVIATANDITQLPPELLRKGRFDEIFFVDLPNSLERRQIFEIHITKRKRDPKNFDIDALVDASEGFSGAETEQAIISGLFDSFSSGHELQTGHILKALKETFPLSRTMSEKIQGLRRWAQNRARMASLNKQENAGENREDTVKFDFPDYSVEDRSVIHVDLKMPGR